MSLVAVSTPVLAKVRFFKTLLGRPLCQICQVKVARGDLVAHAQAHVVARDVVTVGAGTHRAFRDLTLLGVDVVADTGWRTTSCGPG